MARLQTLSNKGHGWLLVLYSMANVIPLHEPLGPAVINLVMDECALPTKVFHQNIGPMDYIIKIDVIIVAGLYH